MFRRVATRCGGRVLAASAAAALSAAASASPDAVVHAVPPVASAPSSTPSVLHTTVTSSPSPLASLPVVLCHAVDCSALRTAQSDVSTVALPVKAHVALLDCTDAKFATSTAGGARIATVDVLSVLHACLVKLLPRSAAAAAANTASKHAPVAPSNLPLLVVVQSCLGADDAELQQLVLRNALAMSPVCRHVRPEEVVVWVMTSDETATFRRVMPSCFRSPVTMFADKTYMAADSATTAAAALHDAAFAAVAAPAVVAVAVPPSSAAVAASNAATRATTSTTARVADTRTTNVAASSLSSLARVACDVDASHVTSHLQETEKELWRSRVDGAVRVSMLRPLLDDVAYASVTYKLTLLAPADLHVLVYRFGSKSNVHAAWRECLFCLADLYEQLTGSKALRDVAVAVAATTTQSAAALDASGAAVTRARGKHDDSGHTTSTRRGTSATRRTTTTTTTITSNGTAPPPRRCLCLLVHTAHLTGGDVELVQQELQALYAALPADVQATQLLAVQVLTSDRISEESLRYALTHSTATHDDSMFAEVYRRLCDAAVAPPPAMTTTTTTSAPSDVDVDAPSRLVDTPAAAATAPAASTPPLASVRPGALVAQAAWVATLLQDLLSKREVAIRKDVDEMYAAMRRQQAGNEELSRAAQKVELKAVMTDVVEEVSARHEQATAHLIKTLSSMVGQWSAEKLLDGLQVAMREQVRPLQQAMDDVKTAATAHEAQLDECATMQRRASEQLDRVVQRVYTREQLQALLSEALRAHDAENNNKSNNNNNNRNNNSSSAALAVTASAEAARTVLATAVREAVQTSLVTLTQRMEAAVQRAVEQHLRHARTSSQPPGTAAAATGDAAATTRAAAQPGVDEATLTAVVEAAVARAYAQQQQQQQQVQQQVQRQPRAFRRGAWSTRRRVAQPLSTRALHEAVTTAMQPLVETVQRTLATRVSQNVSTAPHSDDRRGDGVASATSTTVLPPDMQSK